MSIQANKVFLLNYIADAWGVTGSLRVKRNARRRSALAISVALGSLLWGVEGALRAASQTSTWVGGTSTNWNDATNWTPNNTFPNNGSLGISDFNAIIVAASNEPTLTAAVTIDSLTLNTGATLTLASAITMNIAGPTVTNNGTLFIDQESSNADLNFTANTLLTGSGIIMLNDYNPNARITTGVGAFLTNGANQTINGVGEIDAALINNGVVNANVNGHTLYLQTSNMTNNNLMEATNASILAISGISLTQGANGTIANNGGSVTFSGVNISGGTLSNGTMTVTSNSTFSNVTIAAGTTIVLNPAVLLNYSSTTLLNNGVIQIDTGNSNADLNFTGNTTLMGSGSVLLADYSPNARLTTSTGATLTSNQTIDGVGEIDAALINNGVVNANVNGHTLYLQTSNMTNNNLMEATNASILAISGISLTQGANGTIANNGGSVTFSGVNISGGTLSNGTMTVTSNSTFSNVTIAAGTTIVLNPAVLLNYSSTTLLNNGVIQIDTGNSNADLNFTGNTTLTGSGSVLLNDYSPNARLTTSTGATLTSNQTIDGVGEIDASFVNNAVVNANSTIGSRTITLQTNNMTNNAFLEATNTGILSIVGITITQGANGTIANNGGNVTFTGVTISGGKLSNGTMYVTSASTFSNLTIATGTTIILNPAVVLSYASATFTNNGLIQVDTYGSNAAINFTANSTLTGTGSVFLDDYNPYARITAAANVTFTNNETIYGLGEIDAPFINTGTILANATFGNDTLLINGVTNNQNLIHVTSGSILQFASTSPMANGSLGTGTIQADVGGTVNFPTTFTLNTGILSVAANATINGLTQLTNSGNIALAANATLTLSGSLTGTSTGVISGNGTVLASSYFGSLAITGGTARAAINGTTTGTSKLTKLTLAGSSNAWTSDFDLTNNKLVVEDSTTHAATLATLQNQAFYGRTHATGITSSDLPAGTVIAVADNAAFATPFATFGGQMVDSNSILVAPELLGDTDFSGKVDLTDLNNVLNHLGVATSAWTSGNFDGAATIDLTDLNDVLNNLGQTYSNPNVVLTPTPEPASLVMASLGAVALLSRRRRSF